MALIGTIRKNGWILIATMVLALGGFILMDVVSNSQRYQAADANSLGVVNGKEIRSDEFEQYKAAIYANSTGNDYQVRAQVWNYFVEDAIVREQAEPLGLGVSKEELKELQFGTALSPIITDRFRGSNGMVDMNSLGQIKSAIESGQLAEEQYKEFRTRWMFQEKEIQKQRIQDKMMNLVVKGLYAPNWLAEAVFAENNQRIDFLYVRIPYDKVADSDIKVTDEDYAQYLKENPRLYDQLEETRVVSYLNFEVSATSADSMVSYDRLMKLLPGLKGKDDSLFVVNNDGIYDVNFRSKEELPANFASTILATPNDSVVGPYLDGGAYTIAKVLAKKVLPDSVKARHILLQGATPENQLKIDSLKKEIESGRAAFDAVARAVSQDPGSGSKGGDLGYFTNGMMVPEFNNVCFNTGEQGKLYTVATQFGWHLIEITGKKFINNQASVRLATISEAIRPSAATQQSAKDKALELVQSVKNLTELESKVASENKSLELSQALKASDFNVGLLGAGKDARDIVKWAFDADTDAGDVSKQVFAIVDPNGGYYDARYVVVALRSISPKGAATVATLKANPQVEVEIKARKKADVIKSKLQGTSDLAAAAAAFQVTVDTSFGATFLQTALPKGGPEPRVIGAAFATAKGAVSKPIAGKTGVYMVQMASGLPEVNLPPDMTMFRRQAVSVAQSYVRSGLMPAMKKAAEMTDNRHLFF